MLKEQAQTKTKLKPNGYLLQELSVTSKDERVLVRYHTLPKARVKNVVRPKSEIRTGSSDRAGAKTPTEHSSFEVCTQPERSLRTQQAECFSRSRAARMKLCTCGSWRMQGENLAPR